MLALEHARDQAAETHARLTAQLLCLQEERDSLTATLERTRSELSEAITCQEVLKMRVGALESDLAAARYELEESRRQVGSLRGELEEASSRLSAVMGAIPAENDVVSSDRAEGLGVAEPAEEDAASCSEAAVVPAEPGAGSAEAEGGQEPRAATAQAEAPRARAVAAEEVDGAVFSDAVTKVLFRRAWSDMASQNVPARLSAVRILGGIRHELSTRLLLDHLAGDPSPQVRQECVKALTALGIRAALPALERALADPAAVVRLAAVRGLYRLAGAHSAPALARMVTDDDEEVRRRAATCLGWLGREEYVGALLPLFTDRSIAVRHAAVEATANLRSRGAVPALVECLNDPEESIHNAALSALEAITGKTMSASFPPNEESRERLIARWRAWWEDSARTAADQARDTLRATPASVR